MEQWPSSLKRQENWQVVENVSKSTLFKNETNLSPGPIDSKINVPLRKTKQD